MFISVESSVCADRLFANVLVIVCLYIVVVAWRLLYEILCAKEIYKMPKRPAIASVQFGHCHIPATSATATTLCPKRNPVKCKQFTKTEVVL